MDELTALREELKGEGTMLQIAIQRRRMWVEEYGLRTLAEKQLSDEREVSRKLAEALERLRGSMVGLLAKADKLDGNNLIPQADAALSLYREHNP